MGPLQLLQDRGLEAINRFYGIYRGIVTDNIDEDKQNRVRVIVPQVDPELNVWAYPVGFQALSGAGVKSLTPPVMSMVWVQYINGDPMYPVWSHGHWAVGEIPSELDGNHLMGIVTPNGHHLTLDEDEGILKIHLEDEESPTTITINKGNLKVEGSTIDFLDAELGIPKSDLVTDRLNIIEKDINNLKAALINAIATAVPNDGGKTAFSSLSSYTGQPLITTVTDDIANPKIKQ